MEFNDFIKETYFWGFFTIATLLAYWAKTTKDDLKQNDANLARDLQQHKVESGARVDKLEDTVHQSLLIQTEIKGDIKLLNSNFNGYQKSKHDLENELAGYKGAIPELLRALSIAEKINERDEKR